MTKWPEIEPETHFFAGPVGFGLSSRVSFFVCVCVCTLKLLRGDVLAQKELLTLDYTRCKTRRQSFYTLCTCTVQ